MQRPNIRQHEYPVIICLPPIRLKSGQLLCANITGLGTNISFLKQVLLAFSWSLPCEAMLVSESEETFDF